MDNTTKPEDRIRFTQLAAYGAGGVIPIALFNIAISDKPSLKAAQAEGRYYLNDEIEQTLGPIWTDTVMRPIEFTGEEIEAGAGKPGTFIPRTEKNVVRNLEELTPLLRQEPHVEEFLSPKKKKAHWAVP